MHIGMAKGNSRAEVTLNSEKMKSVALATELLSYVSLKASVSQAVS